MRRSNEPAYPVAPAADGDWYPGLTVRERFVLAAMQVVGPALWVSWMEHNAEAEQGRTDIEIEPLSEVTRLISKSSIAIADDVLAALEAVPTPAIDLDAMRANPKSRISPCGCIACVCPGEERCYGCGAVMCDLHQPSANASRLRAAMEVKT
jgi:hypothetical protein